MQVSRKTPRNLTKAQKDHIEKKLDVHSHKNI